MAITLLGAASSLRAEPTSNNCEDALRRIAKYVVPVNATKSELRVEFQRGIDAWNQAETLKEFNKNYGINRFYKTIRNWLESNGVQTAVVDDGKNYYLRIVPDAKGARLNQLAQGMVSRIKLQDLIVDFESLFSSKASGMFASLRGKKTTGLLFLDFESMLRLRPSPTLFHESVHAYYSYQLKQGYPRGLHGDISYKQADVDLKQIAGYDKYFSMEELATYSQDLFESSLEMRGNPRGLVIQENVLNSYVTLMSMMGQITALIKEFRQAETVVKVVREEAHYLEVSIENARVAARFYLPRLERHGDAKVETLLESHLRRLSVLVRDVTAALQDVGESVARSKASKPSTMTDADLKDYVRTLQEPRRLTLAFEKELAAERVAAND